MIRRLLLMYCCISVIQNAGSSREDSVDTSISRLQAFLTEFGLKPEGRKHNSFVGVLTSQGDFEVLNSLLSSSTTESHFAFQALDGFVVLERRNDNQFYLISFKDDPGQNIASDIFQIQTVNTQGQLLRTISKLISKINPTEPNLEERSTQPFVARRYYEPRDFYGRSGVIPSLGNVKFSKTTIIPLGCALLIPVKMRHNPSLPCYIKIVYIQHKDRLHLANGKLSSVDRCKTIPIVTKDGDWYYLHESDLIFETDLPIRHVNDDNAVSKPSSSGESHVTIEYPGLEDILTNSYGWVGKFSTTYSDPKEIIEALRRAKLGLTKNLLSTIKPDECVFVCAERKTDGSKFLIKLFWVEGKSEPRLVIERDSPCTDLINELAFPTKYFEDLLAENIPRFKKRFKGFYILGQLTDLNRLPEADINKIENAHDGYLAIHVRDSEPDSRNTDKLLIISLKHRCELYVLGPGFQDARWNSGLVPIWSKSSTEWEYHRTRSIDIEILSP